MRIIARTTAVAIVLALVGCAHPITIAPNIASMDTGASSGKASRTVGYFISTEDRNREVTTPGGGGDKITYFPYRDLEPALFKVLTNSFKDVYILKSPSDTTFLASNKVSYVFIPKILTDSSSGSAFTWPPTDFSVSLECKALGPDGAELWHSTVKGEGKATFSEFKSEFGLAGRRAAEQAILQFEKQLRSSSLVR